MAAMPISHSKYHIAGDPIYPPDRHRQPGMRGRFDGFLARSGASSDSVCEENE